MLQCFLKYSNIYNNTYVANINAKKKKLYLYSKSSVYKYNSFFRKFYFRSLLIYINILYSNLNSVNENNYFYLFKYVISNNVNAHSGFLFKKWHRL